MADAKQDVTNGSTQSRVVLAKPRLGGFGSSSFGASSSAKSSNPFGSVLRPSTLKAGANPFLKVSEEKSHDVEKPKEETAEKPAEEEAPKFVPLGSTNVTRTVSTQPGQNTQQTSSGSGFVFGQNLSDRVVMSESVNNGEASSSEHPETNGTTDLLFTSAAAAVKETNQEETVDSTTAGEGLAAAAAEYERSHARPPPVTNYCTTTGEEEENNVLQISCRLFAWESGSWRERGRGVLRLNDAADGSGSRLVARVAGSLRVLLNTKLWPGMVVEKAGSKSLRVTVADAHQQVKLYLIMGAAADISQLNKALLLRIPVSKKTDPSNDTSQKAAERLDNDYQEIDAKTDEAFEDSDFKVVETVKVPPGGDPDSNQLHTDDTQKENAMNDDKQDKSLKRKEPADEETSPKRQRPQIDTVINFKV